MNTDPQAGMGIFEPVPHRRKTDHWLAHWLIGIAAVIALTALFGWLDHRDRQNVSASRAEERAIYRARITDLEAQVAQFESWDCTSGPRDRLSGTRRWKLCWQEAPQ